MLSRVYVHADDAVILMVFASYFFLLFEKPPLYLSDKTQVMYISNLSRPVYTVSIIIVVIVVLPVSLFSVGFKIV